MEGFEKIMMNDGDRDIAMTIVATFTMDDQDGNKRITGAATNYGAPYNFPLAITTVV